MNAAIDQPASSEIAAVMQPLGRDAVAAAARLALASTAT
jgi:hypothetical protein